MRRLHYWRNGSPPDVIELDHVAEPPPAAGEVFVALEASPLRIADLKAIVGSLSSVPPGAGVPGFEGVGTVVAKGGGRQRLARGRSGHPSMTITLTRRP